MWSPSIRLIRAALKSVRIDGITSHHYTRHQGAALHPLDIRLPVQLQQQPRVILITTSSGFRYYFLFVLLFWNYSSSHFEWGHLWPTSSAGLCKPFQNAFKPLKTRQHLLFTRFLKLDAAFFLQNVFFFFFFLWALNCTQPPRCSLGWLNKRQTMSLKVFTHSTARHRTT